MANEQELRIHRDWINTLQPIGLVVSPPALVAAQALPDKNIIAEQQRISRLIIEDKTLSQKRTSPQLRLTSFEALGLQVLGWPKDRFYGCFEAPPVPDSLSLVLESFGETLRPHYAVQNVYKKKPDDGEPEFALLIQELEAGVSLDHPGDEDGKRWHASPQLRMERLLRETNTPAGILCNKTSLRLIYAPQKESSGHITWPVYALREVGGRPLLSALLMLLGKDRLFTVSKEQRFLSLLRESRKYQNVVSTKLADQVLEALNELLRGFASANEHTKGKLLNELSSTNPSHIYGGLLAVIMRLVFVLYAEERGLMSQTALYGNSYSLSGLFEKLRAEIGRFPDTMDQRYGAWSRLLVLFRLIHDGAKRGDFMLPARRGDLFNPDTWRFLEGRYDDAQGTGPQRQPGERLDVPRVSDGVVLRVLEKLLLLDGDRLSYRALDVEQIGSVYENMMGFTLERAEEACIGLGKDHVVVGLNSLLAAKPAERSKKLEETASIKLTGKANDAIKEAKSIDDLLAALQKRISPLTPNAIAPGGLYLQPTDERRRSGSHYTPRELTEPIVRTTLRPIIEDLVTSPVSSERTLSQSKGERRELRGEVPRPEQILALKVCDPAMGSGAFLVEACRQLADLLVRSWDLHGRPNDVPDDEDIYLLAQRQIAQRCLYGVDKNPFAVNLGKLSLWLATLAKGHPFSFVDHSIRNGDSLVGLSKEQLLGFHWEEKSQLAFLNDFVNKALQKAEGLRKEIQSLSASDNTEKKRFLLDEATHATADAKLLGDAVIAAFFSKEKPKDREAERKRLGDIAQKWLEAKGRSIPSSSGEAKRRPGDPSGSANDKEVTQYKQELLKATQSLKEGKQPLPAFHWWLEFPEVFSKGGFDCFVGNPPFLGGSKISGSFGNEYLDYILMVHPESHGNGDLVAHFFRRAFNLLRHNRTLGLIATNTIAQGDTRTTGLQWIRQHGGTIYEAARRHKWPGQAAVIVSVVHVKKGMFGGVPILDGKAAQQITAFLFPKGSDASPQTLKSNEGKSFLGSKIYGQGFLFDDLDPATTPISVMRQLIQKDPRNQEKIFPYLGGEELNTNPTHAHHRYVINFGQMSEDESRKWPDLIAIVETKVKPERLKQNREIRSKYWWRFGEVAPALYDTIKVVSRALANSQVSSHIVFAWQPTNRVFAHTLNIFASDKDSFFAVMQSRIHELWALFFASSLEERLRYTPSDCFETFPFPTNWQENATLEAIGKEYYEFRAALMIANNEGLTKTYNRFHDPEHDGSGANNRDPDEVVRDIEKLRSLHDKMDRAVLDAYGWTDIKPSCEFLLDYEEEEDESDTSTRKKKKPWRYRWPNEVRDDVLARLLELNAKRAAEEKAQALLGAASKEKSKPAKASTEAATASEAPKKRGKAKKDDGGGQGSLL